ncbi:MAG: DNA polymerase IV [Ardenticatenaceae bacterium]|nr:DNA polymerase IV [Ardenticatenaceae bacterium]
MFWKRAILHVDMDAFFVNIHLLDHPEDRGLPIAVGGNPNGRGVVASASYEARQFGVRSAMPSSQALRLCPTIKFVGHNWPRIGECSRQVMDLLAAYGPLEKMSVDEAYVDISEAADPEGVAFKIRAQIKRETGLPASVGLTPNKLVSKVASDFDKPEGCTIIRPGEERLFLAPLSVRAIHGIGPRTAEQLALLNIYKCGELADIDLSQLRLKFGKNAELLQERARGIDHRPVNDDPGQAKSISQEWTFNDDIEDENYLFDMMEKMAGQVSESLKKRNLVAHTVVVKYRWVDFSTFTRQRTVEVGIDSAAEILATAQAVFQANWNGEKLRLIGVGVSNLERPLGRQLTLFNS